MDAALSLATILQQSALYATDRRYRRRVDSRLAREAKFANARLFNLDLEITSGCNLACKTCYNPPVRTLAITLEQFQHTLQSARQLAQHLNLDGLWLTISGGEPLTQPHLWDMIRLSPDYSVRGVAIVTNGTLLDDEKARLIKALGVDEVMISLDGATGSTNDAIRGAGTFARVMKGIEALRHTAPDTFVGSTLTLTSLNRHEVEDFVRLTFDLGLHYAWINPPLYHGRLANRSIGVAYEDHLSVMKLARYLDIKYFRQGFSVYYNIPYYPLTDPISPYLDMNTACPWGRSNLTVTADGSVLPCLYSRGMVLGNVFEQSLLSMYNHPTLMGYRDGSLLAEPCRECDYRAFCGGCRARTYCLTGDWLAADPWCPLVRGDSEQTLRVMPPLNTPAD